MRGWPVILLVAGLAGAATASGAEMIAIPAGVLPMGASDGESAERPVHRVEISAFLIDRYETTNTEFAAFVAATGHVTDAERVAPVGTGMATGNGSRAPTGATPTGRNRRSTDAEHTRWCR